MVGRLSPNVVLMGLSSDGQEDVNLCQQILAEDPSTKVLVISHQDPEDYLFMAVLAGASGYVTHSANGPELVRAIGVVFSGGGYFELNAVQRVASKMKETVQPQQSAAMPEELSERDLEILMCVGEGLSSDEIASELNISPLTARNRVIRLRDRLGLPSRSRLISYAASRGILLNRLEPDSE